MVETASAHLTEADVLALGANGQHVADLDLGVGYGHAVDVQQHESPALSGGRPGQTVLNPCADGLDRGRGAGDPVLARGVVAQRSLRAGQGLRPPLVFVERDDRPQANIGEPLGLLMEVGLSAAQRPSTGEELHS